MGKRHRIWLAGLILAAAGGIVWLLLGSAGSEPVYQGKGLDGWLTELDQEMPRSNFSGTSGPAATAIRQIGTNAIPHLRQRLKARDSWLKTQVNAFACQHRWLGIHPTPAEVWRRRASSAAFCLGSSGSPLMPDLMGVFRSTNYQEAFTVTETLGRLGYCNPETIPALLEVLNEPPNAAPGLHDRASLAFLQLSTCMEIVNADHPDAFRQAGFRAAVPSLLKALNATNDIPLCLGNTLKPCCAAILKRIETPP